RRAHSNSACSRRGRPPLVRRDGRPETGGDPEAARIPRSAPSVPGSEWCAAPSTQSQTKALTPEVCAFLLASYSRLPLEASGSASSCSSTKEQHPMFDLTVKRIAQRNKSRHHRSTGSVTRRARPRMEALEARLVLSGSQTPYLQTN